MSEHNDTFAGLGLVEAVSRLYEGTGYTPFTASRFGSRSGASCTSVSRVLLEGIDFDLTYFPLKHLGYKSVIAVTGELYASFAHPRTLNLTLGISAKLDFVQIRELWNGAVIAAKDRTADDRKQPELKEYSQFIGAYLKPELNPAVVSQMEESEIVPSFGYFVTRGLSDAVKRLVRDSGLGAKIYVDRIPFAGKTFDLGRKFNIDPISAALNGGDDFRLIYTVPIGKHDRFRHDFQTFDIIGHLARPDVGAVLVTPDGVELPLHAQGWKD